MMGRALTPLLLLPGLLSGQAEPMHETGSTFEDNMYVHQWIAHEAWRYFISQIEGAELGAYLGTIAGSFAVANANLLEGTYAEDGNYRDPLNQFMPYNRHFCEGADGAELDTGLYVLFLGRFDSAHTQASRIWSDHTKPVYPANKPLAYYRFGHVVHLLTDMTVPAHVHNDEHPFAEPYENAMGANERFKLYYFGCTRAGLGAVWEWPLGVDYADLRALFYRTANYTEDYDSGDKNGDVSNGAPPYDPGDYPLDWHRPAEVSRVGGMSEAELTITADDLMPYAIRRVAELYRFFYRELDASPPAAVMEYPDTTDAGNPLVRGSPAPFELFASASDPESGVVIRGFRFWWAHWDGAAWSAWEPVAAGPGPGSVSFTPAAGQGLYAFHATAENGGGHTGASAVAYLRIELPLPLYAWLEAWGAGLPEEDKGPLGDMNHDGLCNLLVYVAGGNPTTCDVLRPLRWEGGADGPRLILRVRGDDPHLVLRLGTGGDLGAWSWHPLLFQDGAWSVEGEGLALLEPVEVDTGIWELRLLDTSGRNPALYTLEALYADGPESE